MFTRTHGSTACGGKCLDPSDPSDLRTPPVAHLLIFSRLQGASGSGEGDPSDDRGVRRGVRSEGCGGVLPLRAEGGAEGTPTYVRGPTVPLRRKK